MGDQIDAFREMKAANKTYREKLRTGAGPALTTAGIEFESNNGGAHLIINTRYGFIDFWPGTALWIPRFRKLRCRGLAPLIKFVQECKA